MGWQLSKRHLHVVRVDLSKAELLFYGWLRYTHCDSPPLFWVHYCSMDVWIGIGKCGKNYKTTVQYYARTPHTG